MACDGQLAQLVLLCHTKFAAQSPQELALSKAFMFGD